MSTSNGVTTSPAFKLTSLTRQMRRYSLAMLRSGNVDITLDQWGVLGLLYESDAPMSQTHLANMMVKDSPTVSRILDVLCRQELVVRQPDKEDRRKFKLRISDQGKRTVEAASPIVSEARKQLFKGVSKDELRTLNEIIEKVVANIKSK